MSFRTHPAYQSPSESEISSEVPDESDGVTAFAVAEQSFWVLSSTSVAPLSPFVISTRSGVGRWLRITTKGGPKEYFWNANGDLSLMDVGSLPPVGDGGDGFFDGTRVSTQSEQIVLFSAIQRCTGSSGSTDLEVWRLRGGVFFLLASMSIAFGAPFGVALAAPPAGPDDVLLISDIIITRVTSVQESDGVSVPCDLTVTLHTQVLP